MRAVAMTILAGMALVAASPAFAGRDETQIQIARRAMEGQRTAQLAQQDAQKARPGLAGAKGEAGKVGPAREAQRKPARRLPGEHP